MNPRDIRVLTECDVMLHQISARYQTALNRLHEASPGFPAHTPGAGEPGGGKGFTAGSITDRLVIPEDDKAARREVRRHPELDALERIRQGINYVVNNADDFATRLLLPMPNFPTNPNRNTQRLAWSRWVIRQVLNRPGYEPPSRPLDHTHRSIVELHRTVTAWAYTAKTPAKASNPDLPEDPHGDRCRSCLRVGSLSPRYRGDLCRWCYEFFTTERFLPPPSIIEARASGKRITEAMVAPHRQAHRNKKKRKKAS